MNSFFLSLCSWLSFLFQFYLYKLLFKSLEICFHFYFLRNAVILMNYLCVIDVFSYLPVYIYFYLLSFLFFFYLVLYSAHFHYFSSVGFNNLMMVLLVTINSCSYLKNELNLRLSINFCVWESGN